MPGDALLTPLTTDRQVPREQSNLFAELEELGSVLDNLEGRLANSVLRKDLPNLAVKVRGEVSIPPVLVPLAMSIASASEKVSVITEKVRNILDRLEV